MSESMPLPPPPPGKKPVPPPPPGKSPAPAMMMTPPAARPMMPGMGGGMQDPRLQEMEKKFQEQENARKTLESQLGEMQKELKDEREKLMMQALKAKEEEALSARVETQLREIQDRLKREKYEQELQESRGKAEGQLKDIERRLGQERETWMMALKNQLKERETIERDVEQNLSRKLREADRRYEEEKNRWAQMLRQKEDEIHQIRRDVQGDIDRLREELDEKDEQINESRRAAEQERRVVELQGQSDARELQNKLDTHMRELSAARAQMALMQNQIQQMEAMRQEERSRAEHVRQQVEKQGQEDVRRMEAQMQARIEDAQHDANRRELERTQHWESVLSQTRTEKDLLRQTLMRREEDLAETQQSLAEAKHQIDLEKTRFRTEIDQIRRQAREEAEQQMPVIYGEKVRALTEQWDSERQALIAQYQEQLNRVTESEKALRLKVEIEARHAEQEKNQWAERLQMADAHGAQVEAQLSSVEQANGTLRQELEETQVSFQEQQSRAVAERAKAQEMIQEQVSAIQRLREQLDQYGESTREMSTELELKNKDQQTLQKQMDETVKALSRSQANLTAAAEKEKEWEAAYNQMKEAYASSRGELEQAQSAQTGREKEWQTQMQEFASLRSQWDADREVFEQKIQALMERIRETEEVAKKQAAPASLPQSLQAIQQQMQELASTLSWLRSSRQTQARAA